MWPTSQLPMAWTLTHRIIVILYFLTFWSYIFFWFYGYNVLVTIFGNVHRPCRHHFIIVNNSLYHVYSFSPISWLYLHQLPYWEMCTDHVSNASTLSQRVYIMSIFFLLIFPDFLAIFAWITILGNVRRPCRQCINIVESSLCHATPFLPDLFLVFWAYLHQLPY